MSLQELTPARQQPALRLRLSLRTQQSWLRSSGVSGPIVRIGQHARSKPEVAVAVLLLAAVGPGVSGGPASQLQVLHLDKALPQSLRDCLTKETEGLCWIVCREMMQLVDIGTGDMWAKTAQHVLPPFMKQQSSNKSMDIQEQLRSFLAI